jgi:hypothetical protein
MGCLEALLDMCALAFGQEILRVIPPHIPLYLGLGLWIAAGAVYLASGALGAVAIGLGIAGLVSLLVAWFAWLYRE